MNNRGIAAKTLACFLWMTIGMGTAHAQSVAPDNASAGLVAITSVAAQNVGPITHLPLPRFVSMKARESNVRRGPSLTHRIAWIFKRQDMPLQIVAEHGHWRRVRDKDGMGGWVHYSLLSGSRTVLIENDAVELRMRPDDKAAVVAKLNSGVIARLGDCNQQWCRLRVASHRGWTRKTGLWGVAPDEIRN